jgi:DNA-binding transcriptional MerR regulator
VRSAGGRARHDAGRIWTRNPLIMKEVNAGPRSAANTNDVIPADKDGYSRIGDMAKKYGVTLRALRFYEDKGLLSPVRDGSTRLYTKRDQARLKLILLGRKVGFSLREVKQMIDLYDPNGSNSKQLKVTLEKSERQLVRLEKQRSMIDEAIHDLVQAMEIVRQQLAERTPAAAAN